MVWVPALRSGTTHRIASGTRDDGGKLIAGSEGGRDSIPLPSCPASCRASTSSVVLGIKTWITGKSPVTTGGWRHEGRSNCSSLDRFFTASGDLPVVPMCRSAAKLRASPNQRHRPRVPSRFTRGVSRSSRTSGAGCDGRFSVRQTSAPESGRRSRVVLTPRRWRQVARNDPRGDGGNKARSPGRARRKPLKPFAQGMSVDATYLW